MPKNVSHGTLAKTECPRAMQAYVIINSLPVLDR